MKILIFSDTHLSNRFNASKFEYLKRIITSADQVIINGDFWEGERIPFEKFLSSPWKQLFPLLKKKKAIYLYGNHDREIFNDMRVNEFSVKQGRQYTFKSGNKIFLVEHGHRFAPITGKNEDSSSSNKLIEEVVDFLKYGITKLHLNQFLFQYFNGRLKRSLAAEQKPGYIYIFGHTHCQEEDLGNGFINSGVNVYGIGQYAIIEDGKVTLKTESY